MARNGQEKGRIATPRVRLTTGDMSRNAKAVKPSAERNASSVAGGSTAPGQARRTSREFTADRARISPASSRMNSSQERCALYNQRRSWKTASGGRAVTWGASTRAAGAKAASRAASAMAAPVANAISPRCATNRSAASGLLPMPLPQAGCRWDPPPPPGDLELGLVHISALSRHGNELLMGALPVRGGRRPRCGAGSAGCARPSGW